MKTLLLDIDYTLVKPDTRPDNMGENSIPRPYLAEFLDKMRKKYNIVLYTAGTPMTVAVETLDSPPPPETESVAQRQNSSAPGPQRQSLGRVLLAPLPGVVKSIAIRAGQSVSVGDELLVIEAMKMDNVLRASRNGTIDTVHVVEGHRIAHGETLLEYVDHNS